MKNLLVAVNFLVISIVIMGCGQKVPSVDISNSPLPNSLSPTMMLSAIPTVSPAPSLTPTLAPKITAKPTETATSAKTSAPTSLFNAILTPNDVIAQYSSLDGYFGDVTDATSELLSNNNCLLECIKQVWSAGKYGPRLLTIILIKSQSAQKAQELVDNTRAMFKNVDDLSNRESIAYLPQNTWSAYYYAKNEFVLTYSYGQVFVLLISQPNSGFDDFAGEFDLISIISRLQMEKLSSNGYTP